MEWVYCICSRYDSLGISETIFFKIMKNYIVEEAKNKKVEGYVPVPTFALILGTPLYDLPLRLAIHTLGGAPVLWIVSAVC